MNAPVKRAACVVVTALAWAMPAEAANHPLSAADRAEITALARSFFDATRDGARTVTAVYPTPDELRGVFPPGRAGDAGISAPEATVQRQFAAIERDARALREVFQGGTFVGLSARSYPGGVIDLRPCGRFARATSQCGDGPVIEYRVGTETRRFRLDTLLFVRGHWRIFDVRP